MSVVSPADKRIGEGVKDTRLRCARALVDVAGILVQDGRQDSTADHDVGKEIRVAGAKALEVALCALLIVELVGRLIHAGQETRAEERDWIRRGPEGNPELQLWCERHGMGMGVGIKAR